MVYSRFKRVVRFSRYLHKDRSFEGVAALWYCFSSIKMEFLLFDTGSNFGKMYQPMMQPAIGLLNNGKEID